MADDYIGERQHLTVVAGLDGFWAAIDGGDRDREITKVKDGGEKRSKLIIGDADATDLVLSRPWSASRDAPIFARLDRLVADGGSFVTQITSTDTDADFVPVAAARSWEGELKTVRAPAGNRDSNNAKRLELVFTVR